MPRVALPGSWLGIVALLSAAAAASFLLRHLFKKPALDLPAKLLLLLGLGVFPTIASATSTFSGMEGTTER